MHLIYQHAVLLKKNLHFKLITTLNSENPPYLKCGELLSPVN